MRERITLPVAIAVAVLAPLILFISMYALRLTLPKEKLAQIETQRDQLQTEVSALAGFARGESPTQWAALLQKEEGDVAKRIPLGRRDAELVDSLESIGDKAKVKDLSVSVEGGLMLDADQMAMAPKDWMLNPGAPQEAVHSYVVNLQFQADYRQLLEFLSRLSNLERFVSLDKLSISRNPPKAKSALALRAYYQ